MSLKPTGCDCTCLFQQQSSKKLSFFSASLFLFLSHSIVLSGLFSLPPSLLFFLFLFCISPFPFFLPPTTIHHLVLKRDSLSVSHAWLLFCLCAIQRGHSTGLPSKKKRYHIMDPNSVPTFELKPSVNGQPIVVQ